MKPTARQKQFFSSIVSSIAFIGLNLVFSVTALAQVPIDQSLSSDSGMGLGRGTEQQGWPRVDLLYTNPYVPNPNGPPTALNAAKPMEQLNLGLIPEYASKDVVFEAFMRMRDERFLSDPHRPDMPRRIAWLYPDSGCFSRSAIANEKLEQWGYHRPAKLFIFGPLRLWTANGKDGKADWFYHVASVVQAEGTVYVLDAAIEPQRPLLVPEWVRKMVPNASRVKIAVCNTFAYLPTSLCYTSGPNIEGDAMADQISFLGLEWRRLQDLNRNPELELGASPPWLDSNTN